MANHKLIIVSTDDVSDAFKDAFESRDGARMQELADEFAFTGLVYEYSPAADGSGARIARLVLLGMAWEDNWCKYDVLLAFFTDGQLVSQETY